MRPIVLLILSTVAYAVTAMLSYVSVRNLQLYEYLLALGIGALIGGIAVVKVSGLSFSIGGFRGLLMELSGGFALAISFLGLYALYRFTTLAGSQPLLGLAMLVFLAIDFFLYSRSFKRKETAVLVGGVSTIVLGVFVIQSVGLSFNFGILPVALFLMLTQGIGYYLFLYHTNAERSGARMLALPAMVIVSAALVFLINGGAGAGPTLQMSAPFLMVVAAGVSLALAIGLEVMVVLPRKRTKWGNILERNFANDFTYSDILVVLGLSILLGSYTVQQIIGGLMILAGIVLLNRIRTE